MTVRVTANWVMDPEPESGAREGGDIAQQVFRTDIENLVREALQNSKDAWLAGSPRPRVRFRLLELPARSGELTRFLDAIRWKQLVPHLKAWDRTRGAAEAIHRDGMRLLCIEDWNTKGLLGPEDGRSAPSDAPNHFAPLLKDKLFSAKSQTGSGGSHGLGKATYWAFSSIQTVLANSVLSSLLPGQSNPRLFGRVALAWHEFDGHAFAGPGWFGEKHASKHRAESVMGNAARALSEELFLPRAPATPGTSVLIVGFDEPAEERRDLQVVAQSILAAIEKWYWPCLLHDDDRGLEVVVEWGRAGGKTNSIAWNRDSCDETRALVGVYEKYLGGNCSAKLEKPGDVVARRIELELPRMKGPAGHPRMKVHLDLVVGLVESAETTLGAYSVARFRRPGMVIDYWEQPGRSLGIGRRPFVALLAMGDALRPGESDPRARGAFETFLRWAENPAHDALNRWDRLRSRYDLPFRQPLEEDLPTAVAGLLRELVVAGPPPGENAPRLLMERFRVGGGGPPTPTLIISDESASLGADGSWRVRCTLRFTGNVLEGWRARVDLRLAEDGGAHGDGRLFCDARLTSAGPSEASARVENGIAEVVVRAGPMAPESVVLEATTDPARNAYATMIHMTAVELRASLLE